jgi:hypothetical protein
VSYVQGRQVAAGTANVEASKDKVAVMDANIADLVAQKVQSVQQAVELQDTNGMLARMHTQIWANLSETQRTDIIDAETQLDHSLAAKRQKATG